MTALARAAAALACAVAVHLAAAPPADGFVLRRISIDGDFRDWQGVLESGENTVFDRPAYGGDPDLPADGGGDLRAFAATWDGGSLFLYFRRSAPSIAGRSVPFLVYVDINHDHVMDAQDRILGITVRDGLVQGVSVFNYVPWGIVDPLSGDGADMPGTGALEVPVLTPQVAVGPGMVELEVKIPFGALGAGGGDALYLRPALGLPTTRSVGGFVTRLPASLADNADPLDTGYAALALTPAAAAATDAGQAALFAHVLTLGGNLDQAVEISARASVPCRILVFSDPDRDGDPADGQLLAIDAEGDGSFSGVNDTLSPGADTTGDLKPDTGALRPVKLWGLVLRAVAFGGGPPITIDVETRAALRPLVAAVQTDTLYRGAGAVVLFPETSQRAVAGQVARASHQICNRDSAVRFVDLLASSSSGYPVQVLDGAGLPVSSLALAAGQCLPLFVEVSVPGGTASGTLEHVTLQATVASPASSESVVATFEVSGSVTLEPPRTGPGLPATSVFYPHTLTNATDQSIHFDLAASSTLASGVTFWSDPDGDGSASDGTTITRTPDLAPFGGSYALVVQIDLPAGLGLGQVDTTAITATSRDEVATVSDETAVHLMATFSADPPVGRTQLFPACGTVNVGASGLPPGSYRFVWLDSTGAQVRVSPALVPDGLGLLGDVLDLIDIDPLGTWQVALEQYAGSVWTPVSPGGTAEFTVLGDLTAAGGAVATLATNLPTYPPAGAQLSLSALLANATPFELNGTVVEYVVFRDLDLDQLPDPGETYQKPDGTWTTWDTGRVTCRSQRLPRLAPAATVLDASCAGLGPMQYASNGTWSVHARWTSQCGYRIAERTGTFTVGCTAGAPAEAGPDLAVCAGDAVRLGSGPAAPGLSYVWAPAEFLDDPQSAEPLASPPARTTFSLTAIDPSGCSARDEAVVQVLARPAADAGASAAVCAGESVSIGVPAAPGLTYRWSPAAGLDDPDRSDPVATPAASTTYTVTVTDPATGCAGTAIAVVDVTPMPLADAGPDRPDPGRIGPAACNPALAYRWTPPAGLDDAAACNPFASPAGGAIYCLRVTTLAGGCASEPDCVAVGVANCPSPPAAVARLRLVRSAADIDLRWDEEPLAAGGYRLYRGEGRAWLGQPSASWPLLGATAASSNAVTARDAGAAGSGPGQLYYRVVGVCADGISEGP